MDSVHVRVPATSANLGPGFDALGLALTLYNRIEMAVGTGETRVEVSGEGAATLERDAANLVCRAATRLYRELGRPCPALMVRLENNIPVARGLGSSSSAIVGGLVTANALAGGPLDREALLRLAVELEGHPDNVAPALLGGLQLCVHHEGRLLHVALPLPPGMRLVACVPEAVVSTAAARAALPPAYPRADAVFAAGRAALLVAAFATGRLELLHAGMEDRLHQPYRAPLVPGFQAALRAARAAGADGACLSGSGSTMLAVTRGEPEPVGEAMAAAVRAAGAAARWLALEPDLVGARLEPPPALPPGARS
jgi:homoserine kinase